MIGFMLLVTYRTEIVERLRAEHPTGGVYMPNTARLLPVDQIIHKIPLIVTQCKESYR